MKVAKFLVKAAAVASAAALVILVVGFSVALG
jgi:hypothetical protein